MPRWIVAALIALTPLLARADLKEFVNEETLFAAEADLTKVDSVLVEQWLRQLVAAAGLIGDEPAALPADRVDLMARESKRWLADIAAAGGKHIYIVTGEERIKDGQFVVIIPAEAGGDANKLASLLFSGRADGPTSLSADAARQRGRGAFVPRAQVIGNLAVWGAGGSTDAMRNFKPAPRHDITAAHLYTQPIPTAEASDIRDFTDFRSKWEWKGEWDTDGHIFDLPTKETKAYQSVVNGDGNFSQDVIDRHAEAFGSDYRLQTDGEHPVDHREMVTAGNERGAR